MIVPLITLPHTGTHTLLSFIEGLPHIEKVVNVGQVYAHGREILDGDVFVWGHYESYWWHRMEPVCREYRPIMPMRDPLSVVISHAARGTEMPLQDWIEVARIFDELDPLYVPVDILDGIPERKEALLSVTEIAHGTGMDDWCQGWAKLWPKRNSRGPNESKDLYRQGDYEALREKLPAVRSIEGAASILRPWLERMGYRNLMWWK